MKTKKLVTTAMLLAFALVLSLIQVIQMPFGGSVTLVSMLPVILIGYMYGTKWGILSAFVYSILQLLTGMGTVSAFFLPGEGQMALPSAICICTIDYILAYTALGIGGIFKTKLKTPTAQLCLGAIAAMLLRYLMHIISGAIFFGAWAQWFFADSTGLSQISFMSGFCHWVMNNMEGNALSIFYSIVYNGAYMIPEIIITTLVAPIIYKILDKSKVVE